MVKTYLKKGGDDFKEIIKQKDCYVDKTLFLKELIELGSNSLVLITIPSRFGKSLNMDMAKTFFQLEVNDTGEVLPHDERKNPVFFQNLAISNFPEVLSHLGEYPVIFINFSQIGYPCRSWDEMFERIKKEISRIFSSFVFLEEMGFLKPHESVIFQDILLEKASLFRVKYSILLLSEWLFRFYGRKVVIFIDSFDTMIRFAFRNNDHSFALKFMRSFISLTFKDNKNVRLGCVTGIFNFHIEEISSKGF
jgi:hypothetical protein